MKISVLITCHNRREKTLNSLSTLFTDDLKRDFEIAVFLVDDGSADGTEEAVKETFPQVKIIRGTGNLYWNGGMRLAWETASKIKDYDFYLWLNDDTLLDKNALLELIDCYNESINIDNKPALIVGACRANKNQNVFSYGGRNDDGPVFPDGSLQECKYMNGNVILVPRKIYETIGFLSEEYTHTLGDYDYGLRAVKAGFKCYTTKNYIATCPTNGEPDWCNPKVPLKKRIQLLYSPKGLNITDYNKFRKKFWGNKWILFSMKAYLRAILPSFYNKIRTDKM